MKTKLATGIAASLLFALSSLTAQADPILVTPTTEGSNVGAEINSAFCYRCWIKVELADSLGDSSEELAVGDYWEFDFFNIFVGGLGIANSVTIEATLAFLSPVGSSSSTGQGGFGTIFGILSAGWLTWGDSNNIDLEDDTWLSVEFEDLHVAGLGNSATVSARVQRHGAVSVPEPGTLALLGFGLLFLWLTQPRRRALSRD